MNGTASLEWGAPSGGPPPPPKRPRGLAQRVRERQNAVWLLQAAAKAGDAAKRQRLRRRAAELILRGVADGRG